MVAGRRKTLTDQTCYGTVLYPLIAETAHGAGATRIGLIDIGRPAGLNLIVDRVGITYSDGQSLGDPASPVQLEARVVGSHAVPARAMPEVVARVAIDRDPLDVRDADDLRRLRGTLGPDEHERGAMLAAQLALAAAEHVRMLRGDPVDLLTEALAYVPPDALPVVTTTWTLSALRPEERLRFLHTLQDAAADRAVGWVSVEGVGVAPSVPTFGDRPASGHSILGVGLFDGARLRIEAVGRCWSRGRTLAWLAGSSSA